VDATIKAVWSDRFEATFVFQTVHNRMPRYDPALDHFSLRAWCEGDSDMLPSRKRRPHLSALIASLTAMVAAAPALAQENAEAPASRVRLSGFGTLGLTHHDNDEAGAIFAFSQTSPARRGWSGNLDSVLGLQLDARLLDTTSATVQGVVRAGDDFQPKARMAYVRQQLGQDAAVRLGRIRSPLYLDSDVTEIGFAYLTEPPRFLRRLLRLRMEPS
jgi:hypothetical protein